MVNEKDDFAARTLTELLVARDAAVRALGEWSLRRRDLDEAIATEGLARRSRWMAANDPGHAIASQAMSIALLPAGRRRGGLERRHHSANVKLRDERVAADQSWSDWIQFERDDRTRELARQEKPFVNRLAAINAEIKRKLPPAPAKANPPTMTPWRAEVHDSVPVH